MKQARKIRPSILADQDSAAIADDPSNPRVWGERASSNYTIKNFTAALADTERAIELDPGFADAHLTQAGAQQGLGRSQEALATLDRALALGCDRERAFQLRAAIYLALKEYKKALDAINQAI